MKDELDFSECITHEDVARVLDDWIDYYNNDRYQWELAKLSPHEYYKYIATGAYPLPSPRRTQESRDSVPGIDNDSSII